MNANHNLLLFNVIQEVTTENTEGVGYRVRVGRHVQHVYLSVHRGFAANYIITNYYFMT